MVDDFPQLPLGKIVADVIDNRGKTPPWGENEPIELIETASIVGDNKYPDYSLVQKRVSNETYGNWFRGHPRAKDILVATVGANIGNLSIMKESRGCVAQNLVCLRVDTKQADPDFVYYFLTWEPTQVSLKNLDIGAAQPSIKVPHLLNTKISLPPLPEQHAIAGILGALDDKIEVNRRMNTTLESMSRAVFRRWFVDGVDAANCEEKSLDEIADFLNGLALQKFPAEGNDYLPVIKISQLRTNDTKDADKASTNIPPQYIIEDGDILFSWSGSLVVVAWCGGKGALNQHLFKVTSEKYPKWFYYYWTKHHLADFQEIAAGKATTMGHIQRHHLKAAKVLVPSDKELKEMDKIMSPLLDKIILNNLESRTLGSLRDSLLPKLMRGEVRVTDIQG